MDSKYSKDPSTLSKSPNNDNENTRDLLPQKSSNGTRDSSSIKSPSNQLERRGLPPSNDTTKKLKLDNNERNNSNSENLFKYEDFNKSPERSDLSTVALAINNNKPIRNKSICIGEGKFLILKLKKI